MSDKVINIVVNPSYSKTNWFSNFYVGVSGKAVLKNAKLNIIMYENNLDEICELCKTTSNYVILVSSSSAWENEVISRLSAGGIHSIIIRPSVEDTTLSCSSVSPDYFNASLYIMKYFIETGLKKIAFFAHNPDSSQDVQKYSAYKYALSFSDSDFSEDDVYINRGNLKECVEKLLKSPKDYDALLCANDAAAIVLINSLKESGKSDVLKKISVASFGNTKLLKMIFPDVISASLNFEKAGECAADLYLYLCSNKSVTSCRYTVSSDINIPSPRNRICKLNIATHTASDEKEIAFYSDSAVVNVFAAENALAQCDELDIKIIECVMKNLSYEKTAEYTNTAVTTVKYRLKKIFPLFKVSSKSELYNTLNKYFNN